MTYEVLEGFKVRTSDEIVNLSTGQFVKMTEEKAIPLLEQGMLKNVNQILKYSIPDECSDCWAEVSGDCVAKIKMMKCDLALKDCDYNKNQIGSLRGLYRLCA
ncbi:hypothetical protein ACFL43_04475 [Thermodesulfobacteriota bacterium]